MPTRQELPIVGFDERRVPNSFVRQDEPATECAVFLPGLGYTCDMPLFYYSGLLLLESGADVLRAEYAYNRAPGFSELPAAERNARVNADVDAVLRAIGGQGDYERIVVIAKSLGTRALAHHLLDEPLPNLGKLVWLTPLLPDEAVRRAIRQSVGTSLVVIGARDPYFAEDLLHEATEGSVHPPIVIDDADHSLDIDQDPMASIQALEQVLSAITRFLRA